MTEWNFDLSAMPRGTWTETERKIGKEVKIVRAFKPDWMWLANDKGEVFTGHWTDKGHRIAGTAENTVLVAWMPYVKPTHPEALRANG